MISVSKFLYIHLNVSAAIHECFIHVLRRLTSSECAKMRYTTSMTQISHTHTVDGMNQCVYPLLNRGRYNLAHWQEVSVI